MKLISVLVLESVVNNRGEKKIEQIENVTSFEDLTCDNGHTRQWYSDLSMSHKIPQELLDREKNFTKGIELNEEDYDVEAKETFFNLDEFILATQGDGCTEIWLKNDILLTVADEVDEVYAQIAYEQRSNYEKFKSWLWHLRMNNFISLYFRRRKIKKQREKEELLKTLNNMKNEQ